MFCRISDVLITTIYHLHDVMTASKQRRGEALNLKTAGVIRCYWTLKCNKE